MASLHDASFYCITELELPTNVTSTDANYRHIYSCVCLTSASLGILGAVFQLIHWIVNTQRQDKGEGRKAFVNPVIVISIALANLISCMGVVIRATGLMLTSPPKEVCTLPKTLTGTSFDVICVNNVRFYPSVCQKTMILGSIFESFTDYSFIAGVLWTLAYSADVLRRQSHIVLESHSYKHRSTATYNIICWGLPVLFVVGSLFTDYYKTGFPTRCPSEERMQIRYLVVYLPVVIVMVVNPILLIKSRILVRKNITRLTATYSSREREIIKKINVRFTAIVAMYLLCWLPNIIDSSTQVATSQYYTAPYQKYQWLFPMLMIEAVFNPLQGFYNCFIYGLPGIPIPRCFIQNTGDDLLSSSMEESQSLLTNKTGGVYQRKCLLRCICK